MENVGSDSSSERGMSSVVDVSEMKDISDSPHSRHGKHHKSSGKKKDRIECCSEVDKYAVEAMSLISFFFIFHFFPPKN